MKVELPRTILGRTDLEIVIEEIMQDKITPRWVDATDETAKVGPGWPLKSK